MRLIKLSSVYYVLANRIYACEIFIKNDTCPYVRWSTEDGEFNSDGFPSTKEATEYCDRINKIIEKELANE